MFVHSIIIIRFGDREIVKEKSYDANRPLKTWDVNFRHIVISKLVETNIIFRYLIGYLDKALLS